MNTIQRSSTRVQPAEHACPECNGTGRPDAGEVVCDGCGMVLEEDTIDPGPEWRAFTREEAQERKRTGAPRNPGRHDRGLGSKIGYGYGHEKGIRPFLRELNRRSRFEGKAERNQSQGLSECYRMSVALGLTDTVYETACRLFEQAQDAGLLPGRSIEAMATAALLVASRVHGGPVTLRSVVTVSRTSRGATKNAYSVMVRELGIGVPPPDPATQVPKLCSALELPASMRTRAEKLVHEYGDELPGRYPQSVAVGAIYLASGKAVTQAELSEVADLTPETVRTAAKALEQAKHRE